MASSCLPPVEAPYSLQIFGTESVHSSAAQLYPDKYAETRPGLHGHSIYDFSCMTHECSVLDAYAVAAFEKRMFVVHDAVLLGERMTS
jgi:hypothetical protein